jgi:hypothetical protein
LPSSAIGSEVEMMASSSGASFSMRGAPCAVARPMPLPKAKPPAADIASMRRREIPLRVVMTFLPVFVVA